MKELTHTQNESEREKERKTGRDMRVMGKKAPEALRLLNKM